MADCASFAATIEKPAAPFASQASWLMSVHAPVAGTLLRTSDERAVRETLGACWHRGEQHGKAAESVVGPKAWLPSGFVEPHRNRSIFSVSKSPQRCGRDGQRQRREHGVAMFPGSAGHSFLRRSIAVMLRQLSLRGPGGPC